MRIAAQSVSNCAFLHFQIATVQCILQIANHIAFELTNIIKFFSRSVAVPAYLVAAADASSRGSGCVDFAEKQLRSTAAMTGTLRDRQPKSVAVPIYQTVAYEFDSADHGAALFNLEAEGFRYSRSPIRRPTSSSSALRSSRAARRALGVATGQAALDYAFLTLADHGGNIVAPPQLYGTTHTLLARTSAAAGHRRRFAPSERAEDIEALIDERRARCSARASAIRPATSANRGAGRTRARARRSADRRQHRRDADPVAADRARRRHRRPFADQIHGRPRRRRWAARSSTAARSPGAPSRSDFRMFNEPDAFLSRPGLRRRSASAPTSPAPAASISAPPAPCSRL